MTDEWKRPLNTQEQSLIKEMAEAPSAVGFEASLTKEVLMPYVQQHIADVEVHTFVSSAGVVLDLLPKQDPELTVMIVGHADKIRMQVRHIAEDGKMYINADSMNPIPLVSQKAKLYPTLNSASPLMGTIEAVPAIHLNSSDFREGTKGVATKDLFFELHLQDENKKEAIEKLGIRVGDPILLDRGIETGLQDEVLTGPYLDNSLGCFVATQVAEQLQSTGLERVRLLSAIASHEEIGRMGSRMLAQKFQPDILIAIDADHDWIHAPQKKDDRTPNIKMGNGVSLDRGSVNMEYLNKRIVTVAQEAQLPIQFGVCGKDNGTDGMAAAFASIDCAATNVGIPIRYMHSPTETCHAHDILVAKELLTKLVQSLDADKVNRNSLKEMHGILNKK